MSDLTHTQTRSVVEDIYRVEDVITASTDIPMEVFVFNTTTQLFSRVATVGDMFTYPDNRADAQTDEKPYYRLRTVTRDFSDLVQAEQFADSIKSRLKVLVDSYAKVVAEFVGTTSETIASA